MNCKKLMFPEKEKKHTVSTTCDICAVVKAQEANISPV